MLAFRRLLLRRSFATSSAVVNVGITTQPKRNTSSISTFHMLIEHGYTYVDKTLDLERLVTADHKFLYAALLNSAKA